MSENWVEKAEDQLRHACAAMRQERDDARAALQELINSHPNSTVRKLSVADVIRIINEHTKGKAK